MAEPVVGGLKTLFQVLREKYEEEKFRRKGKKKSAGLAVGMSMLKI